MHVYRPLSGERNKWATHTNERTVHMQAVANRTQQSAMNKLLYSTVLWVVALFMGSQAAFAQQVANCPAEAFCTGCTFGSPTPAPAILTINCGTTYTQTIAAGIPNNHLRFTAVGGRVYTVSLCGVTPVYDTRIYITSSAPVLIDCADEGCGGTPGTGHATITFSPNLATGGTNTYRIYVTEGGCPNVALSQAVEVTITCVDAPPANDLFCNATPLPVSTACNFQGASTLGARATTLALDGFTVGIPTMTGCSQVNGGYFPTAGDIWFSAVVPNNGPPGGASLGINTNEFTICAGAFAVFRQTTNCPAPTVTQLTNVCFDFGLTGPTSDPGGIISGLNPGETVYIRYWERSGPSNDNGTFQICAFDPVRPVNDNPCGARPLTANLACVPQTFSNEYASTLTGSVTADAPTCGNFATTGRDLWFSIAVTAAMLPPAGGLTVTTFANSLSDMAMAWYRFVPSIPGQPPCASGGNMQLMATNTAAQVCNAALNPPSNLMPQINSRDPELAAGSLVVGDTLYIRVWSETPFFGDFSICATLNVPPPNDDPCQATPLPLNFGCVHQPTTNAGAGTTPSNYQGLPPPASVPDGTGPCVGPYNGDVWYTVTVPTPAPVGGITIDLDAGLMNDGALLVYRVASGTCAANNLRLQVIGCAASFTPPPPAPVDPMPTVTVTTPIAGETLYIRAWRQTGVSGNFSICATRNDPPPGGNCIFTVNLFDSGGDGWQGAYVEICNNQSPPCPQYTNLTGGNVSISFPITIGTPFSVTYFQNGISATQNDQNSFTITQTNFNPPGLVYSSPPTLVTGTNFTTTANCAPPPSPPTDCLGALPVCGNGINSTGAVANNNGGIADLSSATRGCLRGNERGGVWHTLNISQDGVLAFTITYDPLSLPLTSYDFALWGPYGPYEPVVDAALPTASLVPICSPNQGPLRCNASDLDLFSGVTGLQYNNALPPSVNDQFGSEFSRHVNVLAGQVYLLYINRRPQGGFFGLPTYLGNNPYTITFQNLGPGGGPLGPNPFPGNSTLGDAMLACGPLPVEMLSFEGKATQSEVHLSWATGSERNSAFYEVQRSANGRDFIPIGRVEAAGATQHRVDYSFVDDAPLTGLSYYRLRQVDLDEEFAYTKTISVRFRSALGAGLDLYPNPANESITVGYELGDEGAVRWRIIDPRGRVADTGTTSGDRGSNRFQIPLGALEPGVYIMELQDGSGNSVGIARFVKE
jgi:hypothetical protein